MEVCPNSYFWWCKYFWYPWVSFTTCWGSQKLLQGLVSHELTVYLSVFDQFLTQWIMTILSKGCKPDSFESRNSLKINFMSIWDLGSNFVECESFLESNSLDILDSIDSANFSVMGFLPLIRKDSVTHAHGLSVYFKEWLPLPWDLSLGNSADSYLCFRLALLNSISYFFFLYQSPSLFLCTVLHEVLLINAYPNVFIFGSFNVHHRTGCSNGLTILVELIDLMNSVIIFLSQTSLLRCLTFLLRSLTFDSHSPALLDLLLSSDSSICSTMAFSPL